MNPRMAGNVLYMSPEALDETKTYTAKLVVFSFGVEYMQVLWDSGRCYKIKT